MNVPHEIKDNLRACKHFQIRCLEGRNEKIQLEHYKIMSIRWMNYELYLQGSNPKWAHSTPATKM